MANIRKARANECDLLSELAAKSEAYWGYDCDYMNKFRSIYNVGEEFISNNPTVVIEENMDVVGFYGITNSNSYVELEYFFIEPKYIGKGYGKVLWNYLIEDCKKIGTKELRIVTSPQAKEFYIKMGAVQCGEVESLLKKGRIIPQLIYKVE